ncbi:MAG: type II secretion system minor pseudopilin GspK [Gammaproteobacteria bacterium]
MRPRRKNLKSRSSQEGVVIVVALFIVALVATMSYVMMARLERDTRRTTLLVRDTQAALYAQGSIAWAMDQLRDDWVKKKPNQLVDNTPIQSPENEANGYRIKSTIYDMQGRFNLNNLTDEKGQQRFKRLLKIVDTALTPDQIDNIQRAATDWILPGANQNQYGRYYTELPQPYRAAHRPMLSASELRLVKGVDAKLFNALQPYIAALPENTQVNVQSASPIILMMLSDNMDLSAAKGVELLRSTTPFISTEAFLNLDIVKNHQVKSDQITVTSRYFLVETEVAVENQRTVLYTLLKRMEQGKDASILILWQSKGVW